MKTFLSPPSLFLSLLCYRTANIGIVFWYRIILFAIETFLSHSLTTGSEQKNYSNIVRNSFRSENRICNHFEFTQKLTSCKKYTRRMIIINFQKFFIMHASFLVRQGASELLLCLLTKKRKKKKKKVFP